MDDLISRNALLEDIDAAKENGGMGVVIAGTLTRFTKRQPAIDAVPVVRCRECRFNMECCRIIRNKGHEPNDFCSYGQRREED